MSKNLSILTQIVHQATQKAGFDVVESDIHLEKTKTLEHGHFACNLALMLSKKIGKNPREIAQAIVDHLESDLIKKAEIAGPGFINLFIEQKFYTTESQSICSHLDDYLEDILGQPNKTIVIDASHPNIAKPMGVHHLLSTILGESIKRIYKRAGWKVIADNFIGDMGTQFGKLMHAIKEWGNIEEIEKEPIGTLQKLYVKFHIESDKDVELDDEGRAEYKKFEEGDPDSRAMWKKIVNWSMQEIQPIYDRLDVSFDYMNGESFYEDKMPTVLEEGRKKGVFVDGEKGAWVVKPKDPEGTPVLIRKSDGTTLYATRDLARIKYWEETWHPDLMVNIVDQAQSFHFKQLFYAQEKLGITQAENIHVSFGRMRFKDLKMSTRKGNIILLSKLLDEAQERAFSLVEEKASDLNGKEKIELARILGIGSVKYNILSQNRMTNITFEWDRMLSFDGNSAPYLMYTLVRAKSVLQKSAMTEKDICQFELKLNLESEVNIMLQLIMYPDAIVRAKDEFKPNHIANYLYQLAQEFNGFYNGNSILQAENEPIKQSRLLLTLSTIKVMESAFELLGLEVPERM